MHAQCCHWNTWKSDLPAWITIIEMAKKFSTIVGQLADIGDQAHQPCTFSFPKRKFAIKTFVENCFQPSCFDKWSWQYYNKETDCAYCFVCTKSMLVKKLRKVGNMDATFTLLVLQTIRMPLPFLGNLKPLSTTVQLLKLLCFP